MSNPVLNVVKVLGTVTDTVKAPNTLYLINKNGYLEIAVTDKNGVNVLTSAPIITDYNALLNLPDLSLKADVVNTVTRAEVETLIENFRQLIVGDAPATLDTIHELAAYFENANSISAAMTALMAQKADLEQGKIKITQIPDALIGGVKYLGTINPNAGFPTASTDNKGSYFITNISGLGYEVGDWAVSNGYTWDRIPKDNIVVDKQSLGLDQVDNTSDLAKPISTATQTALDKKADLVDGVLKVAQLPPLNKTYVQLGNVNNTSDLDKPVSTATANELAKKANIHNPVFTGEVGGISATMVGLGDVDNTRDLAKPVSIATQTELDKKLDRHLTQTDKVMVTDANGFVIPSSVTTAELEVLKDSGTGSLKEALSRKANLRDGRLAIEETPFEVLGGIVLIDGFDPNLELPLATPDNLGHYYIALNDELNGPYRVNDWAISNGSVWLRIPNGLNISLLAKVAFSGQYKDLLNKPTFTKTMVFDGSLTPFIGISKWYPHINIKLRGAYAVLGQPSTDYMEIDIKKNGQSILGSANLIYISPNANKSIKIDLDLDVSTEEFLTVDIVKAKDGSNLSLTLIYE